MKNKHGLHLVSVAPHGQSTNIIEQDIESMFSVVLGDLAIKLQDLVTFAYVIQMRHTLGC